MTQVLFNLTDQTFTACYVVLSRLFLLLFLTSSRYGMDPQAGTTIPALLPNQSPSATLPSGTKLWLAPSFARDATTPPHPLSPHVSPFPSWAVS